MRWPFTPIANMSGLPNALEQYAGQPIPTTYQVLLCRFGSELSGEPTYRQLAEPCSKQVSPGHLPATSST